MNRFHKRILGSLLGLAVGDVLGCPVEGFHPDDIAREYGRITGLVEPRKKGRLLAWRWRLPGAHSDDTQQALTLADVLAEHGRIDPAAVLATWREMGACRIEFVSDVDGRQGGWEGTPGCHRGCSRRFRELVGREEAEAGTSLCDGAAMRVAPVPLLERPDDRGRVEDAVRSAQISHRHPHAVAAMTKSR